MIGKTVWYQDGNKRVYLGDDGNKTLEPNPRHSFRELEITGETSKSWVSGRGAWQVKIDKKTLVGNNGVGKVYVSEQERDDRIYVLQNKHLIYRAITDCEDADKLRRIAAILAE